MYKKIEKWFIFSDTHSFNKELIKSLDKEGFDINNPTHGIIVIGDLFDRGKETLAIYKFIKKIPKTRRVLIRGNHELLYKQLLEKSFPDSFDFSNGTVGTFCQIAKFDPNKLYVDYNLRFYSVKLFDAEYKKAMNYWEKIVAKVKKSRVTKFIFSDEWVNYYDLDNKFILTHCFIPVKRLPYTREADVFFDWRKADSYQWEIAMWGCPWKSYLEGLFDSEAKKGNILVCGHWHTSDFYYHLNHKLINPSNSIYYGKNIIAIDGGVTYKNNKFHHKQNVLVIDVKNKTFGSGKKTFKY